MTMFVGTLGFMLPIQRKLLLGTAIAVVLATSPLALSQDEPGSTGELILELEPGDYTVELARFVGQYGRAETIELEEAATVKKIIEVACEQSEPNFLWAVRVANNNGDLETSSIVEKGSEFLLPPCPPRRKLHLAPRQIDSGDWLWRIWQREFSQSGFAYSTAGTENLFDGLPVSPMEQLLSSNGTPEHIINYPIAAGASGIETPISHTTLSDTSAIEAAWEDPDLGFLEVVMAANPGLASASDVAEGQNLLLPKKSETSYSFPIKPAAIQTLEKTSSLDPAILSETIGRKVTSARKIKGVELITTVKTTNCIPFEPEKFTNIRDQMLGVLAENKLWTGEIGLERPKIVVLDTGIHSPDQLPGRPTVSPVLITQIASLRRGIESDTRPYPGSDDEMHGTNVAAVALTGFSVPDLVAAIGYRFELVPVRIITRQSIVVENELGGPVPSSSGEAVVNWAYSVAPDRISDSIRNSAASIVNMSFSREEEMEDILDSRSPTTRALFIVAAGNSRKMLDNLKTYPGRNGGKSAPNIITVASVDGDFGISDFSNYSASFVDIAAMGCEVPTLSFDAEEEFFFETRQSGTSLSAPQVTWVAAALRAALKDAPGAFLKQRILAGADIHPNLANKISEGRVLNPLKALSLKYDVVDVYNEDGTTRTLRGTISEEVSPATVCSDATTYSRRELLKITRKFDGRKIDDAATRLHYADPDGTVFPDTCTSSDFTLKLQLAHSTKTVQLSSQNIRDITFALKAQ